MTLEAHLTSTWNHVEGKGLSTFDTVSGAHHFIGLRYLLESNVVRPDWDGL